MKKLLVIMISLVCVLTCSSCTSYDAVKERVSYMQYRVLTGETEDFRISVTSAMRESPYSADGIKEDMLEYCRIVLKPNTTELLSATYTFSVTVGETVYDGELRRDPFGSSFSHDVGALRFSEATAITVLYLDGSVTVSLEDEMADITVSGEDALEIARNEFRNEIERESSEGFKREIFVKYVSDGAISSPYYWYVAMILSPTDYWAVLIDPTSGEVIAKRGV